MKRRKFLALAAAAAVTPALPKAELFGDYRDYVADPRPPRSFREVFSIDVIRRMAISCGFTVDEESFRQSAAFCDAQPGHEDWTVEVAWLNPAGFLTPAGNPLTLLCDGKTMTLSLVVSNTDCKVPTLLTIL